MNIAYHCTDNYARITATSVLSLFENNKDVDEINVYIIEHGFTGETRRKFRDLADKYGRNMYFIPLPDFNGENYSLGLVSIKKNWMFDSYSRLFLDRLLPEGTERVIYLDGDILVLGSLKKIWEMDLKGKCCAACLDCISAPYYELFGLEKNSRYCNSGFILIDLNTWRDEHIGDQVKEYVRNRNGYVFFMEQTVFNCVLQGNIKYLPAEYNVSSIIQMLSYEELMKLRKPIYFYSKNRLENAKKNPVIIHMTGFFFVINRAWNENTNHPAQKIYVNYTKMLNWSGDMLQQDRRNMRTRVMDWIIHRVPRPILIHMISQIYNGIRIRNIVYQRKKINYKHVFLEKDNIL